MSENLGLLKSSRCVPNFAHVQKWMQIYDMSIKELESSEGEAFL